MPTTYLPNGHTLAQGLVLDEAFVKIIARQSDGTYKWVHGANNPSTAIESLVWNTNGTITVGGSALTVSGNLTVDGHLICPNPGHIIGDSPALTNVMFSVTGQSPQPSAFQFGLTVSPWLQPVANVFTSFVVSLSGRIDKASSGTHQEFGTMRVFAPSIGGAGATLDEATTVKIMDAPTAATNNYALRIVSGAIKLPLGGGTGVVDVGAADSGGAGFRLLRVPN